MIKKNMFRTNVGQFVLAGLLTTMGSYAGAQTMVLEDNQLQISGGSGTTFSSQSPTISASGVVQTVIDVPSTNGVGIPSFSFTIQPNGVANGDYNFRVGVTIDDDDNARRMEARIETLTLNVNGSTITGSIPSGQQLKLLGRDGSGALEVQANVDNSGSNGPVTITGGKVTFNASNLITKIRNAHASFDEIILAEFDDPASYTYRIAVQQTSGPATIQFGVDDGGFDDFPKVGVDVTANSAFVLNSNALATGFTSAYTVTGQFNVVFVSSNSGGSSGGGSTGGSTTPTGNVGTDTTNLNTALNGIDVTGTTVTNEVVEQLNNVVTNTNTVLSNTASQLNSGTLTTTQALTALTTANSALDKAGTAAQKGGAVSTSSSTTAITNIANVLGALASKGNLTTEEKTQISTVATTTVTNATKLLTPDTPRSAILALVEATASLLQKSNDATGELTAALVEQVKALSTNATQKILPTLPESIKGTVDLNSIDAIRTLATAKATVAQVIQQTSPAVCRRPEYEDYKRSVFNPLTGFPITETDSEGYDNAYAAYTQCLAGGGVDGLSYSPDTGGAVLAATAAKPTFPDGSSTIVEYDGKQYAATTFSQRIVPDLLSDGLHTLPDGRLLFVNEGTSLDISGAALSHAAFESAVNVNFALTDNDDNGSFSIFLGNNEHFSGAFAIQEIGSAGTACESVTFNTPSGNPVSVDYVFEMVCSDGLVQRITPYPYSSVFYDTVTNAGFDVRTDRNTGIISIDGVGNVRPSFFVTPLTLNDTAYLNANKTAEGIAVRTADKNGDGKTDYEIISSDGVQVMYGL